MWAATGPALEAFSRYRVVRITDSPRNERLTVGEFLRQVRRMVVGFAVSRLLGGEGGAAEDLDDPTTYYLMHRNDFGLEPAPAGACILYALSCNLSDTALAGRLGLLARGRSGGELRLRPWDSRPARNLGAPAPDGAPPPLIDRLHRTMQLWRAGDLAAVDAWIDARGLRRHELFARLAQALTELAPPASGERALLESILNHLRPRPASTWKPPDEPRCRSVLRFRRSCMRLRRRRPSRDRRRPRRHLLLYCAAPTPARTPTLPGSARLARRPHSA